MRVVAREDDVGAVGLNEVSPPSPPVSRSERESRCSAGCRCPVTAYGEIGIGRMQSDSIELGERERRVQIMNVGRRLER
jgi:hypothetical protein